MGIGVRNPLLSKNRPQYCDHIELGEVDFKWRYNNRPGRSSALAEGGTKGVVGRSPFPCETDEEESDGDRDGQPEVVGVRVEDGFVAAEDVPGGVWRKPKGLRPNPILQPDPQRRHLAFKMHCRHLAIGHLLLIYLLIKIDRKQLNEKKYHDLFSR